MQTVKIHTVVTLLAAIVAIPLLFGASAFAADCGGVETAIIDCSASSTGGSATNNGVWGILLVVIGILTAGVGVLAVGGIVYGAILYTSAADNAAQVTKAKTTFMSVAIGLVLYLSMYSIAQYFIPGGVFNRDFADPIAKVEYGKNYVGDPPGSGPGGGGDDSPGAPVGPKRSYTSTFSFQNLGREEASASAVFQKIKSSLEDRPNIVYNFAEIDEGDSGEHAALKGVFGSNGWSGFNTRVPTLSRLTDWKTMDSEVVFLHDNTGGGSGPERVMTVTRFQHKQSEATRLATINTMFVAKAYNGPGGGNPRLKVFWDRAWSKLVDRAARLNDSGFDIVISADFNRRENMPNAHANAREVLRNGPDRIIAVPADGRKLTDTLTGVIDTPNGEGVHNNVWARLTFADK